MLTDLAPLQNLKNLETLYIRGNSGLSIEQVYALQQALPGEYPSTTPLKITPIQ